MEVSGGDGAAQGRPDGPGSAVELGSLRASARERQPDQEAAMRAFADAMVECGLAREEILWELADAHWPEGGEGEVIDPPAGGEAAHRELVARLKAYVTAAMGAKACGVARKHVVDFLARDGRQAAGALPWWEADRAAESVAWAVDVSAASVIRALKEAAAAEGLAVDFRSERDAIRRARMARREWWSGRTYYFSDEAEAGRAREGAWSRAYDEAAEMFGRGDTLAMVAREVAEKVPELDTGGVADAVVAAARAAAVPLKEGAYAEAEEGATAVRRDAYFAAAAVERRWALLECEEAVNASRVANGMPPLPSSLPDDEPPEAVQEFTSSDALADLAFPPGLVGDLVRWMADSSDRPEPALYLPAAITWLGALMGQKFAGERNARTNFYCISLAPSGHGKDHALDRIGVLAERGGLDRYIGPSPIMSASGLRRELQEFPSFVCLLDEFGGFARQIHDPRGGTHNQMIRTDLMQYFSRAKGFFAGAAYAAERSVKIRNPNLCINGVSTPGDFWPCLTSAGTLDGLLARMLIFNIAGNKPPRVTPRIDLDDVPTAIVERCRQIADYKPAGGNLAGFSSSLVPTKVPRDAGAEAVAEAFEVFLEGELSRAAEDEQPAINRVMEHANKLALVVAVGCDLKSPVVTREIMDWACRLAWHCIVTLISESHGRIADSERQRHRNEILRIIRKAGEAGIKPGLLWDKYPSPPKLQRQEIVDDLIAAGRVEFVRTPTKGRPRERYVARR